MKALIIKKFAIILDASMFYGPSVSLDELVIRVKSPESVYFKYLQGLYCIGISYVQSIGHLVQSFLQCLYAIQTILLQICMYKIITNTIAMNQFTIRQWCQ
jgi:hypothetical protein